MTTPEALAVLGPRLEEVGFDALRVQPSVMAIDGPAGSGKTTLAAALAAHLEAQGVRASVIHMDDLYDGWDQDLAELGQVLRSRIVEPWLAGRPVRHQVYDWAAGRFDRSIDVPAGGVLILEGVGSASRPVRERARLTCWIEAPREERLRRGLDRDGEALRSHWTKWQAKELAHFEADQTRDSVDVRLET